MAGYSGYLLWTTFLGLDSHEYPLRKYSDLVFRIYDRIFRHFINFLQALLLLLIWAKSLSKTARVSLKSPSSASATPCAVSSSSSSASPSARCARYATTAGSPTARYSSAYSSSSLTWASRLTPLPNYAISILGSAGGAVNASTITPDANGVYPPTILYNGLPDPNSLVGSLNGLLQGVFAYGGAQLFIEFMTKMRRPRDFIKATWGAQFFIYTVYLIYGSYIYHFQGQHAYNISYQAVNVYAWQTVGNMLAALGGLIAAGLYGNVGIKVSYNNMLMEWLRAPPLTMKTGKIL